eukprot:INCI16264.9.p1 GENE.INCI16264.9~~INCI16264.9.p1  ORF type:complete len:2785 (+),score=378.33 INCI16264.9:263-8617(+)
MWLSKQFSPRGAETHSTRHRFDEDSDDDAEGAHCEKFDFRKEIENLVRVRNNIASAVFQRHISDASSYDDFVMQYPLAVAHIKGLEKQPVPVDSAVYAVGQPLRLVFGRALPWLSDVSTTAFCRVEAFDAESRMHRVVLAAPGGEKDLRALAAFSSVEGNWHVARLVDGSSPMDSRRTQHTNDPAKAVALETSLSLVPNGTLRMWVRISRMQHHQVEIVPVQFNDGTHRVFSTSRLFEFTSSLRKHLLSHIDEMERNRLRGDDCQLVAYKESWSLLEDAMAADAIEVRRLHHRLLASKQLAIPVASSSGVYCALHGEQISKMLFQNNAPFPTRRTLNYGVQVCGRWRNGHFFSQEREWLPLLQPGSVDIVVTAAPVNAFERSVALKRVKDAGSNGPPETVVGQASTARDHNFESTGAASQRLICIHCHQSRKNCETEVRGTVLVDVLFKPECMDLLFECHWSGTSGGWRPPRMHVRGRPNLYVASHAPESMLPLASAKVTDVPQNDNGESQHRERHSRAVQSCSGSNVNSTGRWTHCVRCLVPGQRVVANWRPSLWGAILDPDSVGLAKLLLGNKSIERPVTATIVNFDSRDGTYVAAVDNIIADSTPNIHERRLHASTGPGGTATASRQKSDRCLITISPTLSFDLQDHANVPATIYRYMGDVRLSVLHPQTHAWCDATVERWLGPEHGNRHFLRFDQDALASTQMDLHDCNHTPLLLPSDVFDVALTGFLGWMVHHLSYNFSLGHEKSTLQNNIAVFASCERAPSFLHDSLMALNKEPRTGCNTFDEDQHETSDAERLDQQGVNVDLHEDQPILDVAAIATLICDYPRSGAQVDIGATQRALCIIIEGEVGCGKTWAARKLAHSLAHRHLQCQPRMREQRQPTEAIAGDASLNESLSEEGRCALDNDPSVGSMGGTMLPLFVSAVRLEIVWNEWQSSDQSIASKGQGSNVESKSTPPSSPLSIAARKRRSQLAETRRQQKAGMAKYLVAAQFFELFFRNDFGGDPVWEALLLQAFRSRRLLLIVDELDACSADFQHSLGAMLAFDLLPQGHPMVITARNPSDIPLPSASSLESFAMPSSAKATGTRPLSMLLDRDDSVVLRLRPLNLAQQAQVVRCALTYDHERMPTTSLSENMEKVVHGMMILSQIRQMCDDTFRRHYTDEAALPNSAVRDVAYDEISVETEVESIGLAAGEAATKRELSGPFRHVGQCLLVQSNASALDRARQLTCMDKLVRSFFPRSSGLVPTHHEKQGGRSGLGRSCSSPVCCTIQQLREMQTRRKSRALKDQICEDGVNVVVNLELGSGNPHLCFREDAAGRFVTVAPRSNDVRKRILGDHIASPQGSIARTYPGPNDPPKLGEEGLQLLSVNGRRVLRAIGSNDEPVFPVHVCQVSADAPILLDEVLLRAGLQRSVVWSSVDGKDVHFMLHRASAKMLQQWNDRAKVGDAAALSGRSSIVVLHFVGRRIRPSTFVPCADDILLKAAYAMEFPSGPKLGAGMGMPCQTFSQRHFEIPTVDIVCDSQAELVASVCRLKQQCEQLDLAVAAKKLRQAASARKTQKIVTVRTQTGHDTFVGDIRRKCTAKDDTSGDANALRLESSGRAAEHQQDDEDEKAAGEAAGITAHVMSTKSFFCSKARDCIANRRVEVLVVVSMPRIGDGRSKVEGSAEDSSVRPFAGFVRFHLREVYALLRSCPPRSLAHVASKYLDSHAPLRLEQTIEALARRVALIVREAVLSNVALNAQTVSVASGRKGGAASGIAGESTTNSIPYLCLPYQSSVLSSRTRFMKELAALSIVFGNPLALSLFLAALQFPSARQANVEAQDASARNEKLRPLFFGVPLDAFGLYKSAVMARFYLERSDDVDANDMLEISKLVLTSVFATGSSALNFDSKFVGRALKGKISGVERSALAVDTATVLRKNRPVKFRVLADRRRYCRTPVQGDFRADGGCVVQGDVITILPQSQEHEFASHETAHGEQIRQNWVCVKPKHWLYRWEFDGVPAPKRAHVASRKHNNGNGHNGPATSAKNVDNKVSVLAVVTPPRDTLLQVWESQISGAHASRSSESGVGARETCPKRTLLYPFPFFYEVCGGEALTQSLFVPAHSTFLEFGTAGFLRSSIDEFSSHSRDSQTFTEASAANISDSPAVGNAAHSRTSSQPCARIGGTSPAAAELASPHVSPADELSFNLKLYTDCFEMLAAADNLVRCSVHEATPCVSPAPSPNVANLRSRGVGSARISRSDLLGNGHGEHKSVGQNFEIRSALTSGFLHAAKKCSNLAQIQMLVLSPNATVRKQMFGRDISLPGSNVGYAAMLRMLAFASVETRLVQSPPLTQLASLMRLNLSGCNIRGSLMELQIPAVFPALSDLRLAHNYLTGPVPVALSTMPNLRRVHLHVNCLSGELPLQIVRLYNSLGWEDGPDATGTVWRRRMRIEGNKGFTLPFDIGDYVPACECGEPYFACIQLPWVYKKMKYHPVCRYCGCDIDHGKNSVGCSSIGQDDEDSVAGRRTLRQDRVPPAPCFFHCTSGAAPNSKLPHRSDACSACIVSRGPLPSAIVLYHSSSQPGSDSSSTGESPVEAIPNRTSRSLFAGGHKSVKQIQCLRWRSRLGPESVLDLHGVGLRGELMSQASASRRTGLLAALLRSSDSYGALSFDLGNNPDLCVGVHTVGGQLLVGEPERFGLHSLLSTKKVSASSPRGSPRQYRCLSAVQTVRLGARGIEGRLLQTLQLLRELRVLELCNNKLTGCVARCGRVPVCCCPCFFFLRIVFASHRMCSPQAPAICCVVFKPH